MSILKYLTATLLGAVLILSTPGSARAESLSEVLTSAKEHGTMQTFAKEGRSHTQAELAGPDMAQLFRHQNAYTTFRRGLEIVTGEELSHREMLRLLGSDQVDAVACTGKIWTTGVDRVGNVAWFPRLCKPGEKIIRVRVGKHMVPFASDWCLNLVNTRLVKPAPLPVSLDGDNFTPTGPKEPPVEPPVCTGNDCKPVEPPVCKKNCEPVEPKPKLGQNPGNGKPKGNSPFDGITGRSAQNDAFKGSPPAAPMNGQRDDTGPQPGGDTGPSSTGASKATGADTKTKAGGPPAHSNAGGKK